MLKVSKFDILLKNFQNKLVFYRNASSKNEELISAATQIILVMAGMAVFVPSAWGYLAMGMNRSMPNHEINLLDMAVLMTFTTIMPLIMYARNKKLRQHLKPMVLEGILNLASKLRR